VAVIDAVLEGADEFDVVHALIAQVRGIVVEAEALVAPYRVDGALGRGDVEGYLRRVHFESEIHVHLVELGEDRLPAIREIVESLLPVFLIGGREGVDGMPDARAGEAVDDGREAGGLGGGVDEVAAGAGGVDHLLGGALTDAFGLTIAPDVRRQDQLVALVDQVADGLADQVRGNGEGAQAVRLEDIPAALAVALVLGRLVHFEMIAPAGEFDAVIAEALGLLADIIESQVGPLPGEKCDWTSHFCSFFGLDARTPGDKNKSSGPPGQMGVG
jgi:hypothetical protein